MLFRQFSLPSNLLNLSIFISLCKLHGRFHGVKIALAAVSYRFEASGALRSTDETLKDP